MHTRHAHQALPLVGTLLLSATSGCPSPDPRGGFDRFNEQTEDDRYVPDVAALPDLGPVETSGGPVCPNIDGVFLVAIETTIAPGLPLQFIAAVDAELDEWTGDGTITIDFQPLSLDPGSTTMPREEVGTALHVDADVRGCTFLLELGEIMVTGEANPITGSDIVADLSLEAAIPTEDAWCGNLLGDVISPLAVSLEHSTFAALRLADRSDRPVGFPVSCAQVLPGS